MSPTAHLTDDAKKSRGAHYTPPALAEFLANATLRWFKARTGAIRVLDPACGDGSLLLAIANAAELSIRARMQLVGYETDEVALAQANDRLTSAGVKSTVLRQKDFLEAACNDHDNEHARSLFTEAVTEPRESLYDIIISNPPYVRTQVLGAERAQELAKRFGLTGRVDLYHAFITAMKSVLSDRGMLGLLTSNRFMLIQSGAAVRNRLRSDFQLHEVYDLGDTKLFEAAVLPAVLVAERNNRAIRNSDCSFVRVYEVRGSTQISAMNTQAVDGVLPAIEAGATGFVKANGISYLIERGVLVAPSDSRLPWSLMSSRTQHAIETAHEHRKRVFDDVGRIRVGIKTTADSVFIRDDWDMFPVDERPEEDLLRPLITHHVAHRWAIPSNLPKRVLYPHELDREGRKRPVDLNLYPRSRQYLEAHHDQLESRQYVIDAGRRWYEIWVPQRPQDWGEPKVVFPDITEAGKFFLDRSGAIVNGDCYWITLRPGRAEDWLLLLLAVGNSSFIQWYYDARYHNKLYAGRRRFMTQYVKQFPLPSIETPTAKQILRTVRGLIDSPDDGAMEAVVDDLVWQAFGLEQSAVFNGAAPASETEVSSLP